MFLGDAVDGVLGDAVDGVLLGDAVDGVLLGDGVTEMLGLIVYPSLQSSSTCPVSHQTGKLPSVGVFSDFINSLVDKGDRWHGACLTGWPALASGEIVLRPALGSGGNMTYYCASTGVKQGQ